MRQKGTQTQNDVKIWTVSFYPTSGCYGLLCNICCKNVHLMEENECIHKKYTFYNQHTVTPWPVSML